MTKLITPYEIRALPVADRLQLIEDDWVSLAEASDALDRI